MLRLIRLSALLAIAILFGHPMGAALAAAPKAAAQQQVAAYKSAEYAEETAAKDAAKTFRETLEKSNYEVVKLKVEKEPTASDDVFQYAFIIAYRARSGFAFQPIRRYYRDGFSSVGEAKKAYDEWLAANVKKGAVLLLAQMGPVGPSQEGMQSLTIDYAHSLERKK